MEDMAVKSARLMALFEQDSEQFSNELQQNMRTLADFQRQFDQIQQHFDEIEEMNRKSKQMRDLVKNIMKRYGKANPVTLAQAANQSPKKKTQQRWQ